MSQDFKLEIKALLSADSEAAAQATGDLIARRMDGPIDSAECVQVDGPAPDFAAWIDVYLGADSDQDADRIGEQLCAQVRSDPELPVDAIYVDEVT